MLKLDKMLGFFEVLYEKNIISLDMFNIDFINVFM